MLDYGRLEKPGRRAIGPASAIIGFTACAIVAVWFYDLFVRSDFHLMLLLSPPVLSVAGIVAGMSDKGTGRRRRSAVVGIILSSLALAGSAMAFLAFGLMMYAITDR
jgi:hypothetical protein